MKFKQIFKNQKGVVGISQIMIATAIIGLATTVSAANYDDFVAAGRDAQRVQNIRQVHTALYMYSIDHGIFPVTDSDQPTTQGWQQMEQTLEDNQPYPYMPDVPEDPLNQGQYRFKYTSDGITFKITYQTEDPDDESPRVMWGL